MSTTSPLLIPAGLGSATRRLRACPRRSAVSVVIPTLNEGAQISAAVADLAWASEVIVVDGGSTDDTVTRAQAARGAGARSSELDDRGAAEPRHRGRRKPLDSHARRRRAGQSPAPRRGRTGRRRQQSDTRRLPDEVPEPLSWVASFALARGVGIGMFACSRASAAMSAVACTNTSSRSTTSEP